MLLGVEPVAAEERHAQGRGKQMRIVRVPVFDEGTFQSIVRVARHGGRCVRYQGQDWMPVEQGRRFAIYRRVPSRLAWIQQRVDDYELYLYRSLAVGHYGRDGQLRPRSRVRIGPTGVFRGL